MVLDREYEHVVLKRENEVLTVELNRPDVHNAFNDKVIEELTIIFQSITLDEGLLAVVVTGLSTASYATWVTCPIVSVTCVRLPTAS